MGLRRVSLVTGGASGVGVEIGRSLGLDGHAVAIVGRSPKRLARAEETLRGDVADLTTFQGDVRDESAVKTIVSEIELNLGPIEVVVHAAGTCAAMGPTWEVEPGLWRADLDTSLLGTFLLVRHVVPRMVDRGRGRLIALSSYAAVRPAPHNSGYGAGKAAVVSLVESVDAELAGTGVHAFSVTPGFVWTEMTTTMTETPWFSELAERRDALGPELVATLVARVARGDADLLSGRFLHALDDLDELVARAAEVKDEELYTPRLRRLQPRSGT